ncbi:MAG: hypothetical protein AMJ43_04085 [Coxiella sp. DG_40]|nr:MAG: hypothetical protein AMJ43_04085 [Coxiella sp. DG_40]
MASEKQIEANKQNALLSTGATSEAGKKTVSKNAIKHGIFTKSLIISNGDGKEIEEDYNQLLDNLIKCLSPQNQIESLLVEKIGVDFWRLRRVINFETGSIRSQLDMVIYDYYNPGSDSNGFLSINPKSNKEIGSEIKEKRESLSWNNKYIKALKRGVVKFDKPEWQGDGITSDIADDFYNIIEKLNEQKSDDQDPIDNDDLSFEEMREILTNAGFKTDREIANVLVYCIEERNTQIREEIQELEIESQKNQFAEEIRLKVYNLPSTMNVDKILRYEKSIQNSIVQNLILLKKMQSSF